MEAGHPGTPVTDGEQWSDDTERSNNEIATSPQNAGYVPLEQQYLALGEDDDEEGGEEGVQSPGRVAETWEGSPDYEDSDSDVDRVEGGRVIQRPDVASLLLTEMESDYRACLTSEERLTSNGSVAPAADDADRAAEIENHNQGQPVLSGESHPEEDSVEGSTSVTDLGRPVEEAVGLEGRGEGDVVTEERPPRPISPLGEDRAERVMRAMQGFALSAPALPHPRFEADWRSPGALANLAPSETAGGGRQASGENQDGPSEDR